MQNQIPQGYKQTKLGVIPEEWKLIKLSDIVGINESSINSSTEPTKEIKYVSLSDIQDQKIHYTKYTYATVPGRAKREVQINDILFSTVRPNLKNFAIVGEEDDLIASTGFSTLTEKSNSNKFLFFYLNSVYAEKQFYQLTVGSNYPALNFRDVKKFKIILPPKPEQQAIARCLGLWDKAIDRQRQLVNAQQTRQKALGQQLLTGKKRLPGFDGEWRDYFYNDILKQVKRPVKWNDNEKYDLISVRRRSGGLFHRESLFGNQIKTKKLFTAKKGDFLMSKMQIVHGAAGLVTSDFAGMKTSGSYITLIPKDDGLINTKFLNRYSKLPYFYHQTYRSSYGVHIEKMSFNLKLFLKEKIRLPELKEQTAIAEVLETAEREIDLSKQKLTALQAQKKGLMQQLLTGKKRLEI